MLYNYNEDLSTIRNLIPGDKFMVYDRKSIPSKTRVRSKNKDYNIFVLKMLNYSLNYPHSSYCFDYGSSRVFGKVNPFKFLSGNYYASIQKMHDRQDSNKAFKLSDLIGNSRLSYNLIDNTMNYIHSQLCVFSL
jgi:hypothetical protein